ncbi:hypothetical protein PR048_003859 [Dryococelus australis]|uniref:HTH OST-type domain-containing protein n=1 Tax=Dryococelus australis TaxID=614101 RepID=A0ABQ9IP59_9NEOP|nr:hypothetical protein PR048_003859 [Dryococelus australis]
MTDLAVLRDDVKLTVRALVKSYPTPMTLDMLEKDYVTQVGKKIPFLKLGYTSLIEYLRSIPEAIIVEDHDDSINLKASNIAYVGQLLINKSSSNGIVSNRLPHATVFVWHYIQHSFYKLIMNRNTGVTVLEMEKFWKGGKTLQENGIQCTVREFLQASVTHLAYFREDRIYPVNLRNVTAKGSGFPEEEDLPVLKRAAHVDDRTKKFMRNVLAKHPAGIHYSRFPEVYKQATGVHFECNFWGYHSVLEMALHMPEIFHCIQTSSSDWNLLDARQPVPHATMEQSVNLKLNDDKNSSMSPALQHGLANGYSDLIERCSCEKKVAVVRRFYGNADFLKTLKSCALSGDAPCGKYHKIPQLRIPHHISPGAAVQIHVSKVVSPERFYFVLKDVAGKDVLDHLLTVMYEFYCTSHRQFQVNRDDVAEGLFCVVLYCGRCLRSQVCGVLDSETVVVRFVDYGVVVPVNIDNLYYFHPAFGFFPQQALVGRVARLHPVDAQQGWSQDAIQFLYNILVNSLVTAVVTCVNTEEHVITAELVAETDDQEYIHVEQKMIALGYALRDKNSL